jgi:hypothetical protein
MKAEAETLNQLIDSLKKENLDNVEKLKKTKSESSAR